MNFSLLVQKSIPHLVAIFIFVLVTVVFYSPLIFENKTLNQNDINQGVASGKELVEFRKATGEEGLWTNSMFGGMPAYLINTHWSGSDILMTIEKIISLGFPLSARETFLSLLCFYILLIVFGVRPYLAIAGAIAYAFSSFFIVSIEAGHLWKVRAIAYAPLVLAGVHLTYLKKYWIGFAVTSLALALELNSNHLQISYYLMLILFMYGLTQLLFAFKAKRVSDFAISSCFIVVAVLIAVGTNLGKIWSTYEYGKYSIRGKSELSSNTQSNGGLDRDYAFGWSSGIAESFTFVVPNFYGGGSGNYSGKESDLGKALRENNVPSQQVSQYERGLLGYWGSQPFTSGPVYVGAVICFLFLLGILVVEPKYKWWLVIVTIISIMLSWGKNFSLLNYFLFDHLPMYNKFRAVSMTVFMAILAMPLLGFIGLEKLISGTWTNQKQNQLWIAGGITLGVILLIAVVAYVPELDGDQFPDWLKNAVESSRKSIVRRDAFRSLFFFLASFATIYFLGKGKLKVALASLILIIIVSLDLIGVDYRYINSENFVSARKNIFLSETPADQIILKDTSLGYRVLNMQSLQEARTSAFHRSLGGYHGAKMRRYQDIMDQQLTKEMTTISQEGHLSVENTNIISMLNAKYLLLGTTQDAVIQNPYANGSAWFVHSLKEAHGPDEEMETLTKINTKTEAVIDVSKFVPTSFEYDSASSIVLTDYAPNRLLYNSSSSKNGYAVFSEIYYPHGWKASIDNKDVSIDRVNYILRGLNIPAGDHTIEFRFEPQVYFIGNKVMWISCIALLISFAAAIFVSTKKQ